MGKMPTTSRLFAKRVKRMYQASLPMYDLPELRPAADALWAGIAHWFRREGVPWVPERLLHEQPVLALWTHPNLLFSQCCGYDLISGRHAALRGLHWNVPGPLSGESRFQALGMADHQRPEPANDGSS